MQASSLNDAHHHETSWILNIWMTFIWLMLKKFDPIHGMRMNELFCIIKIDILYPLAHRVSLFNCL